MSKNSRSQYKGLGLSLQLVVRRISLICIALITLLSVGCRYDMQDQPRYKAYKKSDFFADKRASRDMPEGTVARGLLKENKAFYTGQVDNPDPNAVAQTSTDAAGNTIVTSFPNAITEFPIPVDKAMVERGRERYNIYCIVCHGPVGAGDGMIVRRGFTKPPTFHDDRLRSAPVGHYFDVISNGWGRMNGYGADIPAADRWAVVAYIRALQLSQNPDLSLKMNANTQNVPNAAATDQPANANTNGGAQ